MAPKKKEKNLKRSNIITLKLTDIELAVLNEATGITGLSRSEYLRKLLLAPFAHSFASTSELLPPRKLVDMINTFFAIINQLRFLQKISGFYQMGLHPDYRKDLYEQPLELSAALYWMCTCCP